MAEGKISIPSRYLSKVVEGSTDNYGRLFTDFDISGKIVVGVLSTSNGIIALQLRLSTNKFAVKFVNSMDMTPVANTTCACNVYYI